MTATLTIVTNKPAEALDYVLGVDAQPAWCSIVTEPGAVAAMPDGTHYIGVFFQNRKYRSALEWALIHRRIRGGIEGMLMSEIDGLAAWHDRLKRAAITHVTSLRLPDSSPSIRSEP